MATKTGKPKTDEQETAFLESLADVDVRDIGPETARTLLQFRFGVAQHRRMRSLSEKAQRGTLTPAEQRDLDE